MATFSEDIALTGTGTITVTDGSDSRTIQLNGSADDGDASVTDNVLTITPDTGLAYDATYDVLISDHLVFTQGAYETFVAGPAKGKGAKAVATESEVEA